jgi:hypothetical protein
MPLRLPAEDLKQRLPTAMEPAGQFLTSGVGSVVFASDLSVVFQPAEFVTGTTS